MNAIEIKGLKVSACHGVLPSEKECPQLFVFDISVDVDIQKAAESDEVSDTVDYADVCSIVSDYCKANSFNLIERLARGAALTVLKKYPSANAVEVTVHKPHAPVPQPFGDVSVFYRAERNTVILSLGSSLGDSAAILNTAIAKIGASEGVNVLKVSRFIKSAPYGGVAENEFLNCALSIECLLPPRALLKRLNDIEAEAGRTREKRWADRTLDIDIIFFGDKIMAEEGLCVPHPDYYNRPFVIEPIKEIAPSFVCPLLKKRLSDM